MPQSRRILVSPPIRARSAFWLRTKPRHDPPGNRERTIEPSPTCDFSDSAHVPALNDITLTFNDNAPQPSGTRPARWRAQLLLCDRVRRANAGVRTLMFRYLAYSDSAIPAASARVHIGVYPSISLHINPRQTTNDGTINWYGRVVGGPYPAGGLTLLVQGPRRRPLAGRSTS